MKKKREKIIDEMVLLGHKGREPTAGMKVKEGSSYSKTKTSWHLWSGHEASLTMPNFH